MYPRVKVKEEEIDQDQYEFEMRSLQSLKGFKFISLDDLSFLDDSPTSIVRIPRMSSSNSAIPMVSALKGEYKGKIQNGSDNNKTHIRASLVPRPRAVLSSPDNDVIITHKIKQGEELQSGSNNQVLSRNRHLQCKKPVPVPVVSVRRDIALDDTRSKPRKVVISGPIKRAEKSKSDKTIDSGKPAIIKQ